MYNNRRGQRYTSFQGSRRQTAAKSNELLKQWKFCKVKILFIKSQLARKSLAHITLQWKFIKKGKQG